MKVVKATTVDRGLQAVLTELNKPGNAIDTPSRNGPARRFKGPATIVWNRPMFRVSFDPVRDANPAFHLFESLWMLFGGNDVERPKYFASQMGQFSDDGKTFHGAYGHRWIAHFDVDQLRDYVIPALRKNRDDRRVVLQMWDGGEDPGMALRNGKDVPCNLTCTFDGAQQDGRLHLSVFNRSNDLVWGATGANIVQFSMLLEYVASAVGMGVGTYSQISTNSHIYLELNEVSKRMLKTHADDPQRDLPYHGALSPLRDKTEDTPEEWHAKFDEDINLLMNNHTTVLAIGNQFKTSFFREVVWPVIGAFNVYKNEDDLEYAMSTLMQMLRPIDFGEPWYAWHDWNVAMYQWLNRRVAQRNAKIDAALVEGLSDEQFADAVKSVWKKAEQRGTDFIITDVDGESERIAGTVLGPEKSHRFIRARGLKSLF